MKIAIVGGGVVGLSAARSLVEAGCDVTVFDAQDIPNPASASYDRSRMMLQYGPQSGYSRLAKRTLTAWMELQDALGVQFYRPTGVCIWPATAGAWTAATPGALRDAGVAYREVSPEADAGRFVDRTAVCTENLDSTILMVKAAEHRSRCNSAKPLNDAMMRCVLVLGQ